MASKKRGSQRRKNSGTAEVNGPLYEVRRSGIHGFGVYAVRPIRKGTRILEYLGERISHAEADRRYEQKGSDDGHTFLFVASQRTVIDAGVNGNEARFMNHSCDPNCESVTEDSRVYVDAIRDIKPGEELGYDYSLTWESTDDPTELALYACRCGARRCRGTMLDPEPSDRQKPNAKAKTHRKGRQAGKRETGDRPQSAKPAQRTARANTR